MEGRCVEGVCVGDCQTDNERCATDDSNTLNGRCVAGICVEDG